jgi:homoserine dehydrogenase
VIFVGVFVDTDRASDVISYGVGAGALVTGLALFSYATSQNLSERKKRVKGGAAE